MAASSRGLAATPLPSSVKIRKRVGSCPLPLSGLEVRRRTTRGGGIRYCRCCSSSELRKQAGPDVAAEEIKMRVATRAMPAVPFPSSREKEWGINLLDESIKESSTNEDGSTWYRESGEDTGDNGYKCRWARMGGQCSDGSSKWKETWWEKSDWTGYKELGAEKSGKNAAGDSWWETWQEVLHQDEWSNLARIERSAQKQAKSGTENAGWYEKRWEKYDAKGSTEKGAHKYGRLNEQSWWKKWGEQYDGRGFVLKWTDKWAETELGTRWGDKWEEKFFTGIGSRQGETWHVSPSGDRWSRIWGEEHFGNGKVHKYGKSTTGESWDTVVDEETYYEVSFLHVGLNLIMVGLMLWVIQANCYQYSLRICLLVYTRAWILDHHHPHVICHPMHLHLVCN